jgi:hypothetical protein
VGSTLDIIGLIAEVFVWVGLVLGAVCLLVLLVMRTFGGRWIEADGVAVTEAGETRLRWMSLHGLHERFLDPDDRHLVNPSAPIRLYYSQRDPSRIRFDAVGHGERTLRLLSWLLLGLGLVALVVSIVLIFIPA